MSTNPVDRPQTAIKQLNGLHESQPDMLAFKRSISLLKMIEASDLVNEMVGWQFGLDGNLRDMTLYSYRPPQGEGEKVYWVASLKYIGLQITRELTEAQMREWLIKQPVTVDIALGCRDPLNKPRCRTWRDLFKGVTEAPGMSGRRLFDQQHPVEKPEYHPNSEYDYVDSEIGVGARQYAYFPAIYIRQQSDVAFIVSVGNTGWEGETLPAPAEMMGFWFTDFQQAFDFQVHLTAAARRIWGLDAPVKVA